VPNGGTHRVPRAHASGCPGRIDAGDRCGSRVHDCRGAGDDHALDARLGVLRRNPDATRHFRQRPARRTCRQQGQHPADRWCARRRALRHQGLRQGSPRSVGWHHLWHVCAVKRNSRNRERAIRFRSRHRAATRRISGTCGFRTGNDGPLGGDCRNVAVLASGIFDFKIGNGNGAGMESVDGFTLATDGAGGGITQYRFALAAPAATPIPTLGQLLPAALATLVGTAGILLTRRRGFALRR